VHGIKGTRVYSLSSDLDHPESYINLELGKGSKFQTRNQDIICTKKALHAGLTVYMQRPMYRLQIRPGSI
jgi:hypothetical protein